MGTTTVKGFGILHCAGCEDSVGFFPSDAEVQNNELELYCLSCAENLHKGLEIDKN